jgi:hypothetical protein
VPSGALNNFLIHLQAGELVDARTYFAPGLVTPSPQLDSSLIETSNRLRHYEIKREKPKGEDLPNGERRESIPGKVRPRTPTGQPTPAPDEGWEETDIITARLVERGPGWRILDFELKCCPGEVAGSLESVNLWNQAHCTCPQ